MYFVVIMAFAFLLSEGLPPAGFDLLRRIPGSEYRLPALLLAVAVGQIIVIAAVAFLARTAVLRRLGSTPESHERAINLLSSYQRILLGLLSAALAGTMLLTPWLDYVRLAWRPLGFAIGRVPLLGDLLPLAPFIVALATIWTILFPVEMRIRHGPTGGPRRDETAPETSPPQTAARTALNAAKHKPRSSAGTLGTFLADKFRHQVLIIAAPMTLIVLSKRLSDALEPQLVRWTSVAWAGDALLGILSLVVLATAPVVLRHVWVTEPLPAGALRNRFERMCDRIGLRYREILLWHTHGTAINAAVMGFIAPMRYILVSDALLETMSEDEIEAVFGHEAGHVRHRHLQFFGVFALLSMYISGGVILLASSIGLVDAASDLGLLQLIALSSMLIVWLFGFGWLSRRFERQADLYAVRAIAPDIQTCVPLCPVHAASPSSSPTTDASTPSLCVTSANLFGRTLLKIADLNGISRDAPSWRHGSIRSRCRLIERFLTDGSALRRFNRSIVWTKVVLLAGGAVGTVITAWIYGEPLLAAIRLWLARS